MADKDRDAPLFTIPLPGGRVARVPLSVLEKYVDEGARSYHGSAPQDRRQPSDTSNRSGEGMITINIYADRGRVSVNQAEPYENNRDDEPDDDVTAHSMSVDAATGTSEWHTDWEQGECDYTDEAGFPQRALAWHRHPFGTEYTELYEV